MNRKTIRTIGRLVACLALVVGFSLVTAGCAENKCGGAQGKQCPPDCAKTCDKEKCATTKKCDKPCAKPCEKAKE